MIGAGIFTTTGILMNDLLDPYLLIALWVIGGLIAIMGALSYGELGANFPKAGGEYVFLNELFHPILGFLSGWVSFLVGFSAPIAASALGVSEYMFRLSSFPLSELQIVYAKKLLAILVILVFTFIHVKGLKQGARIQNVLTLFKVAIIFILIVLGFVFGTGNFDHFNETVQSVNFTPAYKSIGLSLLWISFAYSGWNASTYIGSEVKNAARNIPLSLWIGTLCVILLYVLLNILFVYAIPPAEMKGVISIGGLAVNALFGLSMDRLFSVFIAFALLSSLSAFIIIGPRIYYSMSKKGHFFKAAAYVNKNAVPSRSILFQSALAIVYVITGTFEQILTFLGISLSIFPILTVLSIFKLRAQKRSKYKISGYPYTQIVFLALSMYILITSYMYRPKESSLAILVVLIGIPAYYMLLKKEQNNTK